MENAASFVNFLHERGYTYNGKANISGLTPNEIPVLKLGYTVKQEQKHGTNETTQSDSYEQRKRDLVSGYR